jgi:NAD dependent epimerase/dehydratase family enzyme
MQGVRAGAQGVWNGTAPSPVRNEDFTHTLAKVLWRPALIPAPAFAIQMVFGEMAEVVLASQRVVPQAALAAGYPFRFRTLEGALQDLLG